MNSVHVGLALREQANSGRTKEIIVKILIKSGKVIIDINNLDYKIENLKRYIFHSPLVRVLCVQTHVTTINKS